MWTQHDEVYLELRKSSFLKFCQIFLLKNCSLDTNSMLFLDPRENFPEKQEHVFENQNVFILFCQSLAYIYFYTQTETSPCKSSESRYYNEENCLESGNFK